MEQRSAIPWCDRRRMYCASGCSLRDKLSNSGACDWEARAAALPPVVYTEADRQLSESDRQPMDRQQRANPERQSRPQEQARQQPGPRNQPHPRAKFDNNNRRKGPGGQRRPNEAAAAAAAAVPAAAVPVQAEGVTTPATVQPDMFTAPPAVQTAAPAPKPAPAPAPAAAVEKPVAESPAAND